MSGLTWPTASGTGLITAYDHPRSGPTYFCAVNSFDADRHRGHPTDWLGGVLGEDQGISREEAIRAITQASAYTTFEEGKKGSIEPGMYADFVVLAEDILTVPAETIHDIEVVATVLAGEVVYGSLTQPTTRPQSDD